MHDDRDIIKAIRRQPEQGFRQLLQRYQQPVYWYARRMVVSHADVQYVI
jgi:DNA-directed RNA polymerase specialized sigma24 family protein